MNDLSPAVDEGAPVAAPRRTLLAAGVAAIVGLLIAGFGLFTAQGTRIGGVPAEDAAVVNGVPILMVDFVSQLHTLFDKSLGEATRAEKAKALDDMIREELYVQRGVELGMANDDIDVRAALAQAADAQIAADAALTPPSEEELRAWFDAHRKTYAIDGTLDAADYLVPPGMAGRAHALADALARGAAPADIGLRDTGLFADGPQFLAVARTRLGDTLYRQALRLSVGGVSSPVARAGGLHLLQLRERRAPISETFEDTRPQVTQDWIADRTARLRVLDEHRRRDRADVKIAAALR